MRAAAALPALVLLVAAAAHWSSPLPDGLETVAGMQGFAGAATAQAAPWPSDAAAEGRGSPSALPGLLGALLCLGLASGLAGWARRRAAADGKPDCAIRSPAL